MITQSDYFRGAPAPSDLLERNAKDLLNRVNLALTLFTRDHPEAGTPLNSGYRSAERNAQVLGAAPNSNHMRALAADIGDKNFRLGKWVVRNASKLAELGLWCEDPRATPGWVHFQSVPPRSGARFYFPTAESAARLSGEKLQDWAAA